MKFQIVIHNSNTFSYIKLDEALVEAIRTEYNYEMPTDSDLDDALTKYDIIDESVFYDGISLSYFSNFKIYTVHFIYSLFLFP